MTSELAKATISDLWAQGLKPTCEDIIRLNALGLRVERGEDMTSFAAVPRHAFLGDNILHEPSLAVRIWLDEAATIFTEDYFTRLCLTAYALNTPAADLPALTNAKKCREAVERFRDETLLPFTETEIASAVDYALTGAEPEANEAAAPSKRESPAEVPREVMSYARSLLARAARSDIPADYALGLTVRALESLIANAVIAKGGAEVVKAMKDDAVGEFYRTADSILERLKGETNGTSEH